jgi:hypothetical protein
VRCHRAIVASQRHVGVHLHGPYRPVVTSYIYPVALLISEQISEHQNVYSAVKLSTTVFLRDSEIKYINTGKFTKKI